jgi:hypothetical protein
MPSTKSRIHAAAAILLAAGLAPAQGPVLHYAFDEGGSPATTDNVGSFAPGASPILGGMTMTSNSANGTPCLVGVGGSTSEVTTPYTVNLGNASWTLGFFIDNSANPDGFQYVMGENLNGGWRVFTNGGAGMGNIRMAGGGITTADIDGGAGDSGWVHVAWVHDTLVNRIYAYLDGVNVLTVLNANPSLTSGAAMHIGRNLGSSLLAGTRLEDFRFYERALSTSEVAAWSAGGTSSVADFSKVMISEVSPGTPDCVELTNHDSAVLALTGWRVKWRVGSTFTTSTPLNVSIAPGESIVVTHVTPSNDPIPPGTQVLNRFTGPTVTTDTAFSVGLLDAIGTVVDEVRVAGPSGLTQPGPLGGRFRGTASWAQIFPAGGTFMSFERIWGLDSDAGADWTQQAVRSLGRENRSSGPRGVDPIAVSVVRINEIDDSPDLIELFNPGTIPAYVGEAFLIMHSNQGANAVLRSIPTGTFVPPNGFLVLGEAVTPPTEIPPGVGYLNIGTMPFTSNPLSCALYDRFGRLLDVVRTTSASGQVVHNHPRAPSHWGDFGGAAGRNDNGGDDAIGRDQNGSDTNTGADFRPIYARTMGSVNTAASFAGAGGFGDRFDVRLNETAAGQGLQAIINAGPALTISKYNFLVSSTHSNGLGPFFGLGADAFTNLPVFYDVPPFSGFLDYAGSGRIDFDPGSLPPGVNADFIFVLQDPGTSALLLRTLVLEFDT